MKPRILVVAMAAVLGSGCSSLAPKDTAALKVEPVLAIHDGVTDPASYYQLGRYYQGQNRLAKAENAYLKAVALDDRNVDALNALGSIYAERGELERAIKMFQKLVRIAPDVAYLRNNLGFAYYLRGRMAEAYAAVVEALRLDASLGRGWVNLERIAEARHVDPALAEAIRLHRLDGLPSTYAADSLEAANRPQSPTGLPAATAKAVPAARPESVVGDNGPGIASLNEAGRAAPDQGAAIVTPVPPAAQEGLTAQPPGSAGGHAQFVLVSANRTVAPRDGAIRLSLAGAPEKTDASPPQTAQATGQETESENIAARVEVSNGNGVSGFARRFSALLKENQMTVSRITNNGSFAVRETEIQYGSGYAAAARTLKSRFHLPGRLVSAQVAQRRADIRIILGRDAVDYSWQGPVMGTHLVRNP